MTDEEKSFVDTVKKFQTCESLEDAKRHFFAKNYDKFESELKLAPYRFFRSSYNYSEDYDGVMPFIASNFVSGLVKELENYSKYFFVVHRCVQPSPSFKCYQFQSLWIINVKSLEEIYGSRCNDFTFDEVNPENVIDFAQFLLDFRHQLIQEEKEPTHVVYDTFTYDPFSFAGDEEDEEENESSSLLVSTPESASNVVEYVAETEEKNDVVIAEQYLH